MIFVSVLEFFQFLKTSYHQERNRALAQSMALEM